MVCVKCKKEIPDGAPFCCWCGKKQEQKKATKRGNGTGSVYKRNDKWVAEITRGYRVENEKVKRVVSRKCGFRTKKEAIEYLPMLAGQKKREKSITWRELYETWLPTHRAGKSTIDCYKSAEKYFYDLEFWKLGEIEIDDLQECLDECPRGRRTRENMKALAGLMYKYAVPRGFAEMNLAQYLIVSGESGSPRASFTDGQLEKIRRAVDVIPFANYVYAMCYLGFRPSELISLTLDSYDKTRNVLTGGAKTQAGKNRIVPISPKIQPIIDRIISGRTSGALFCDENGEAFSYSRFRDSVFYPTLEAIGITNPIENGIHKYSPHTCRHTFATLMKKVIAPDKDKMELIGHASPEMLRYYQDVNVEDLKKIINAI